MHANNKTITSHLKDLFKKYSNLLFVRKPKAKMLNIWFCLKHVGFIMVFEASIQNIVFTLISFVILWIIISIPVWLAGKAITGGEATFGDALLATLAGPIVYFVVTILVDYFLGAIIGSSAFVFGYILALIAWVWVYKASFETGWLRAILIAILAWILFVVLSVIVGVLFGVAYPSPFFPTI